MTRESQNVERVRAWADAFNRNDIPGTVKLFADPFLNRGRAASREMMATVTAALKAWAPDLTFTIDHTLAAGDEVAVRGTYAGTHLGVATLPLDGGQLVGVEPTGRKFSVMHIHWFVFKDGLIAEHSAARDDVGMLVQLGILSPPPPFPAPPE